MNTEPSTITYNVRKDRTNIQLYSNGNLKIVGSLMSSSDARFFIAQEVEAALPALAATDKEGYKAVAYANAVPVLVEAVKEQQTQIETQAAQIERQEKQIAELKAIVCAIKPDAAVCRPEDK